jgi:hypothetical protein
MNCFIFINYISYIHSSYIRKISFTISLSHSIDFESFSTQQEERDKHFRRTAIRYVILAIVLTYRKVSRSVRDKYPTLDSLVQRGEESVTHKLSVGQNRSIKYT